MKFLTIRIAIFAKRKALFWSKISEFRKQKLKIQSYDSRIKLVKNSVIRGSWGSKRKGGTPLNGHVSCKQFYRAKEPVNCQASVGRTI